MRPITNPRSLFKGNVIILTVRGLPQGGNQSPKLFCAYVYSMWRLFGKVVQTKSGPKYLFMVDHALLISTKEIMLSYIQQVVPFWKLFGIEASPKKTKIMPTHSNVDIKGLPFDATPMYVYLGSELVPMDLMKDQAMKSVKKWLTYRERFKDWYVKDDIQLDKQIWRAYEFTKNSHKIVPYLLVLDEDDQKVFLNTLESTFILNMRKRKKFEMNQLIPKQIHDSDPAYLEEFMILQVIGINSESLSKLIRNRILDRYLFLLGKFMVLDIWTTDEKVQAGLLKYIKGNKVTESFNSCNISSTTTTQEKEISGKELRKSCFLRTGNQIKVAHPQDRNKTLGSSRHDRVKTKVPCTLARPSTENACEALVNYEYQLILLIDQKLFFQKLTQNLIFWRIFFQIFSIIFLDYSNFSNHLPFMAQQPPKLLTHQRHNPPLLPLYLLSLSHLTLALPVHQHYDPELALHHLPQRNKPLHKQSVPFSIRRSLEHVVLPLRNGVVTVGMSGALWYGKVHQALLACILTSSTNHDSKNFIQQIFFTDCTANQHFSTMSSVKLF